MSNTTANIKHPAQMWRVLHALLAPKTYTLMQWPLPELFSLVSRFCLDLCSKLRNRSGARVLLSNVSEHGWSVSVYVEGKRSIQSTDTIGIIRSRRRRRLGNSNSAIRILTQRTYLDKKRGTENAT